MATFYNLNIKEVTQETADAVSVVFNIPENLTSEFHFSAGQYITLQKEIDNNIIRRAYSICSTPESGEVRVAIKAVEKGVFSTYATTLLKAGDALEISAPEGRFSLQPEANKNYIGFAAGSGITPVLSMLKTVLETEPTATFTLIYGNKSIAETLFFEALNSLKEIHSERLNLHYIFSREDVKNALRGRINENVTDFFVKSRYKETTFDAAYLCGPEAMIKEVSKTLTKNNVSKENIHFNFLLLPLTKKVLNK